MRWAGINNDINKFCDTRVVTNVSNKTYETFCHDIFFTDPKCVCNALSEILNHWTYYI